MAQTPACSVSRPRRGLNILLPGYEPAGLKFENLILTMKERDRNTQQNIPTIAFCYIQVITYCFIVVKMVILTSTHNSGCRGFTPAGVRGVPACFPSHPDGPEAR